MPLEGDATWRATAAWRAEWRSARSVGRGRRGALQEREEGIARLADRSLVPRAGIGVASARAVRESGYAAQEWVVARPRSVTIAEQGRRGVGAGGRSAEFRQP